VLTQNPSAPADSFVVDASGNVGIGTSSPTSVLELTRATYCAVKTVSGAVEGQFAANQAVGVDVRAVSNHPLTFYTNNTEGMRIDASGNVLIGYASLPTNGSRFSVAGDIAAGSAFKTKAGALAALGGNGFNINWTGSAQLWIDATNVGTITLTSDYRIKKNVETNVTPALERIAQIRPVTYELTDYKELFKADGVAREGFIAHELAEVIPSAVDGEKDSEDQIQSLKLDALCSVMVKAIQELNAKVEAQAEQIKALQGAA
jgi:hypothetical protein